MPPRRAARAAMAAASKANRKKRAAQDGSDDDHDDIPPLLGADDDVDLLPPAKRTAAEEEDDDDDEDEGEDEEGDDDDDDEDLTNCLHCQEESDDIQVRCDECSAYICNSCHWCHEFQANHEIRVCDRCDAFYCRGCDEMDQCDDCGEVACASCSTLLSCKFCGGGLCEECATACGRCGIVLCSRDAKFAVDCDTCRLSYCLVCLASGSKDPCVRCGHRPSKRMEQLVHLRLKSIYKAFKQSSGSGGVSSKKSPNSRERQNDDPDSDRMADDPEELLRAAATAAKNSPGGNKHKPHRRGDSVSGLTAEEKINLYQQEKEKADAAAAALLAELEEEEEAVKSKKKKKKKKKAAQKAKKEAEMQPAEEDDRKPSASETAESSLEAKTESTEPPESSRSLTSTSGAMEVEEAPRDVEEKRREDAMDPLEAELIVLVADEDIEGIEELLASVKGVPGRAVLRKNAKKALKRLRAANEEMEEAVVPPPIPEEPESPAVVVAAQAESNRPGGATTPVVIPLNDVGDLLKIVSRTHSKQTGAKRGASGGSRSECVMHMSPGIVGWVIGKGGQRIRDLMEESGARIWIDQDSMSANEPRTVYVSGQRKSVEMAVGMIQDLVHNAPILGTPQSKHSTNPVDVSAPKVASGAAGPPPPSIPDTADTSKAKEGLTLKPKSVVVSNANNEFSHTVTNVVTAMGRAKTIITCEARFVPLLIGRRGWTIKNIQDTTGAKVDINQKVTPRKITISGTEESVKEAVCMVEDVLSYPDAQLNPPEKGHKKTTRKESLLAKQVSAKKDSRSIEVKSSSLPAQQAVSGQQQSPALRPQGPGVPATQPLQPQQVSPVETRGVRSSSPPPPSSLIMTGDAQSTSSSLSSTPEPSMSSVAKASLPAQTAPGPMLSPVQGRAPFQPGPTSVPQSAFSQMHPSSPAAGVPMYSPVGGNNMSGPDQFIRPTVHLGNPLGPRPLPQGNTMGPDPSAFSPTNQGFGPLPGPLQNPMPLHQQSALHSSGTNFPIQNTATDPQISMPSNFGKPDGPSPSASGAAASGLWGGPPVPSVQNASIPNGARNGQDGFRLDAAVDFLQHSSMHRSSSLPPIGGGVNDLTGLSSPASARQVIPIGLERRLSAPAEPPMNAQGRNDAQMVDSLFGPNGNTESGGAILTGLRGLSINSEGAGSGLWGTSNSSSDDVLKGLPSLGGFTSGTGNSSGLFEPAVKPRLSAAEQKTQSRFLWGGSSSS